MKYVFKIIAFPLSLLISIGSVYAAPEKKVIAKDENIVINEDEFLAASKLWPSSLKEASIKDSETRSALLNQFVISKKRSKIVSEITEESHPEKYWELQFRVRELYEKVYEEIYFNEVKIPDMNLLAKEIFNVNKKKYIVSPESRLSSNILFKCMVGCERKDIRKLASEVLKKLELGADFTDMVNKYSDDDASKARGGLFNKPLIRGQKNVDMHYVKALFDIEKVGDYILVENRFGLHILRLDEIKGAIYKDFDLAKEEILKKLTEKYKRLSLRVETKKMKLKKDAYIDDESIKSILKGVN